MSATLPERMTAIAIREPGGPEVLVPVMVPRPEPGPGEVLIRVAAAGVNRPDVLQRLGRYPPPPGASELPGLEVAGVVAAVGPDVARFRPGDAVCALLAGGGYADYACAPEPQVLPLPRGLSFVEGAALPETFFTVWHNVFERGRLAAGESFLVHGGASGIGTTAIQLARAFGARVFATVGTAAKKEACERLGAERVILYREEDFVRVVKEATQGRGVDVILDMVGGDYVPRNLEALAVEGRLVQIAWLGGSRIAADFARLMFKRLWWTGSTLRARSVADKGRIAQALEKRVWPRIERGEVRPVIFRTLPLEQAAEAHRLMEADVHIGKLVLTTAFGRDHPRP